MITGMTGFGASEAAAGQVKASVEVKTVNHRYLDVAFYLPSGFSSFEEKIHKKEFMEQLSVAIFQYVKKQRAWFRKDKNITWFDATRKGTLKQIRALVKSRL